MKRYTFGTGIHEEIEVNRGEAKIKPVEQGAPAAGSVEKTPAPTGSKQSATPATPPVATPIDRADAPATDYFSALDSAAASGVRPVEDMEDVPGAASEIASGYLPAQANQQVQETSTQSRTQTQGSTQIEAGPRNIEAENVIPNDIMILRREREEEDREEAEAPEEWSVANSKADRRYPRSPYQNLLKNTDTALSNIGKVIKKLPDALTSVARFRREADEEVEIAEETVSNKVAPRAREILESEVEQRGVFGSANAASVSFYDPIVGDFDLNPAEISMGVEVLRSLHERGKTPKFVEDFIKSGLLELEEFEMASQEDLTQKLNELLKQKETRVIFEKFPTTNPGDQAAFYLQVHVGRAIKLFPTMAKLANADYDGDAGRITTKASGKLKNAVELMVTTAYRSSIDAGFFPLPKFNKDFANRLFPRDLFRVSSTNAKAFKESLDKKDYATLAKVISQIADASFDSRYERSMAVGKIWKEIYRLGRIHYGAGYVTNVVLNPLHTVYQSVEALPENGEVEKRIKSMLEACLTRKKSFNYAELKDALNSNLEWEPGKNYEYRIAADFAKYARRTDGITFKEDGYAYMTEDGVSALYDGLVDHLYSLHMSSISEFEISKQGQKAQLIEIVLTEPVVGEDRILSKFGFKPLPKQDFIEDDNGKEYIDQNGETIRGYYAPHRLHPRDFLRKNAENPQKTGISNDDFVCWSAFMLVAYTRYKFYAEQVDAAASTVFESSVKIGKRWGLKEPERIAFKDGTYLAIDAGTYSKVVVHLFGNMTLKDFLVDFDEWGKDKNGGAKRFANKAGGGEISWADALKPYLDKKISDSASWNDFYYAQNSSVEEGKKDAWRIDRLNVDNSKFMESDVVNWKAMRESGPSYLNEVVNVIFDYKTFASQKYCQEYLDATDGLWEWLKQLRAHIGTDFAKNWDATKLLEDGVAGINYLAPEVYTRLGVSSTRDFVTSVTGKSLLATRSVDEVRNIDLILRIKYRLDKVAKAWDSYQAGNVSEDVFISELDSLASSGPIWKVLANEFISAQVKIEESENGKVVEKIEYPHWEKIKHTLSTADRTHRVTSINKTGVERGAIIDSIDFWQKNDNGKITTGSSAKYNSIFEVLFSEEVSYDDKISILSDYTKLTTGVVLRQTEVPYLIAKDRQTIFGDSRYQPRDGFSQDIEYLKESSKQFSRYVEGRNDALEQLDELCVAYENAPDKINEAIEKKIERLSKGETNARVPLIHLAEGMVTCLRKFSKDSEKSQQQQVMNGLYTAWSMCKNGLVATDWRMLSDFSLGQISYEDLVNSPTLMLKILTNPNISVEVYNRDGVVEKISGESLLAKYKNKGGWLGLLRDNPGLIMAMREHESNFIKDGDGSAYLQATSSFKEFIEREESSLELAMDVFSDKPGFFAIAAAMTNIKGVSPRNATALYEKSIIKTASVVAKIAQEYLVSGGTSSSDMRSIAEKYILFGDQPFTVKKSVWDQKKDRVLTHACWYADLLIKKLEPLGEQKMREHLYKLANDAPISGVLLFPNKATLHTVEDVEQMFFGAKTAVSTGANGAMSREINTAATLFADVPDNCGAEPREVPINEVLENPRKYLGLVVHWYGRLDEIDLIDFRNIFRGEKTIRIYDPVDCKCQGACCKNHTPADGSSDIKKPADIAPLATFAQLIRTDSTERLNLKFKKVGFGDLKDRKGDSVAKVDVIEQLKKAQKIRESVESAYKAGGWSSAVEEMSSHLSDIISQMGYEIVVMKGDEVLSIENQIAAGFANGQIKAIAHAMLREVTETNEAGETFGTGVRFISLRAATLEVTTKVSAYNFETTEEFVEAQRNAFATAGTTTGDISVVLFNQLKRHSKRKKLQSMIRQESSDWGRNFSLLHKVAAELASSSRYRTSVVDKEKLEAALFEYVPPKPWYSGDKKKEDGTVYKGKYSDEWKRFKKDWRIQGFFDGTTKKSFTEYRSMLGGPGSCFFITGKIPSETLGEIFKECQDRKITLAMDPAYTEEYLKDYPSYIGENVVLVSNYGMDLLPFFEMELNGISDTADQSLPPIGAKRVKPGEFVRLVETTAEEFLDLADSNVAFLRSLADRFKFYKNGEHRTALSDAFGFSEQLGTDYIEKSYRVLSAAEAQGLFTMGMKAVFDLGVTPNEANVARFEEMLRRWERRCGDYDAHTGNLRRAYPGEIVGFVECLVYNKDNTVDVYYSPIIPYDEKEGKSSVEYYTVDEVSIDYQTHDIVVKWHHEKELGEGMFFKIFEGLHSANKMIAHVFVNEVRHLFNGAPVDCFVHEESTKSRRTGTLMRDCMHTMICEARHSEDISAGYNAAESRYFLGTNPDGEVFAGAGKSRKQLKDEVLLGSTTMEFWKEFFDSLPKTEEYPEGVPYGFYSEEMGDNAQEINKFLTATLRRCFNVGINPGVFLASKVAYKPDGDDRRLYPTDIYFRYDAVLDNTEECQNGLMAWFNLMMPWICPPNRKAGSTGDYMFIPSEKGEPALVTLVPHKDSEGNPQYRWEHLFTSIPTFSRDTSALMRPSAQKGYSSPSSLQNKILSGYSPSIEELRALEDWGRVNLGDTPTGIRALVEDNSEEGEANKAKLNAMGEWVKKFETKETPRYKWDPRKKRKADKEKESKDNQEGKSVATSGQKQSATPNPNKPAKKKKPNKPAESNDLAQIRSLIKKRG